jgi:CDP-glucose 4,6-dehydratase
LTFWVGKRVWVSGSEGLIGKPLADALVRAGATPIYRFDFVLDNSHDVTNGIRVRNSIETCAPDIVFHLAANSGVESSRSKGRDAWAVNVMGTVNVLEACRDTNVQAVVVASSNHVYGKQDTVPSMENAPLRQLDTYSATKIAADYATRSYWHNYKVPTVAVRNTNCTGPDDPHLEHIIPATILALLRGEAPVIKSTGTTRKSYLHVDDVVSAYLVIAEAVATGKFAPGEAINVSDKPVAVLDIVNTIRALMGGPAPVVLGQTNDQNHEWLDTLRIELLGWKPKYTLDEALADTIRGFRERFGTKVTA